MIINNAPKRNTRQTASKMVVGRSLESCRDYFVEDFITHFTVRVVAVGAATIQYF